MEAPSRSRRPSSFIDSIVTFNSYNDQNQWNPLSISKGSWIIMQQSKRRKKSTTNNQFLSCWKGRVKDFRATSSGKVVKEILVQHVFMHKELHLQQGVYNLHLHRPNCKFYFPLFFMFLCSFEFYCEISYASFLDLYPSNIEDWEPVECVVDIIEVIPAMVGEEMYKGRAKGSLAKNGVFFYDHFYNAPSQSGQWGSLTELPLPGFCSGDWPLPNPSTSENYRCKLFHEVQKCLKSGIASKQSRVVLFMPIIVFIDFFSDMDVRISKTMFSVKSAKMEDIMELVDEGWNMKVQNGITCNVVEGSVTCKYMLSTQNFIMTFFYSRWHNVGGNVVPLDQNLDNFSDDPILDIDVWLNNELLTIVKIRSMCTLHQLRMDMQSEEVETPTSFSFQVKNLKVNIVLFILIIPFVKNLQAYLSGPKKTRENHQDKRGARLQSTSN